MCFVLFKTGCFIFFSWIEMENWGEWGMCILYSNGGCKYLVVYKNLLNIGC